MYRLFAILLFLPFASFGATVGWLCRLELHEYHSKLVSANTWQGEYTGRKSYQWRKFPPTASGNPPTWADWGLTQWRDPSGKAVPNPINGYFAMWICINILSHRIDDSNGADISQFQPISSAYTTPMYISTGGEPYLFDTGENSRFLGYNQNFGAGGSLNIIQGQFSQPYGDLPVYLTYDANGQPVYSTSQNDWGGYQFAYNPDTGMYDLQQIPTSTQPNIDFSPLVTAINTQGGNIVSADNSNQSQLRSMLIEKLGSAGNSWVYDCKLSLAQLYDLASTQGLLSSLDSQRLEFIDSNLSTITPAVLDLANKDFSPTINVAAPNVTVNPPEVNVAAPNVTVNPPQVNVSPPEVNVTVNPAQVNIDTSSLATESTLASILSKVTDVPYALNTRLSTMQAYQKNIPTINSRLLSIYSILDSWNTGNDVPSTLPQPDLDDEDSPNDKLPSFAQGAWGSDGVASDSSLAQIYGDMVDWGNNGTPTTIVPDFVSGFLSSFVGSIPSVGSDPNMFDFSIELPYIGLIEKHWSWSDFPYVADFRAFLVWLVYLFFGLACFKLLHKTMI